MSEFKDAVAKAAAEWCRDNRIGNSHELRAFEAGARWHMKHMDDELDAALKDSMENMFKIPCRNDLEKELASAKLEISSLKTTLLMNKIDVDRELE